MTDTIKAALLGGAIGIVWALTYILRTGGF